MQYPLTPEQITLINQRAGNVAVAEAELKHAKDKLESFIVGVLSAKGVTGSFKWSTSGGNILVEFPEEQPVLEG